MERVIYWKTKKSSEMRLKKYMPNRQSNTDKPAQKELKGFVFKLP